ncbi:MULTISPECIES: acyl carrier protein [unclassified Paenibacillus]|uniref:acyl carrier protein n=1 Tax=unclassified Paenibacillus TaxID=185978 RepID=UPI0030FC710C
MEQIKEKTKGFLSKFYRKREISDSEDIFALGFVNSLFAMQLVMFMEKEFSIRVENNDLDMNKFRSIESIAQFVEQKKAV